MTRRLVLVACLAFLPMAPPGAQEARYFREGRYLVHEITGVLRDPVPRVRVETDLGSVSAVATSAPDLRYRIRVRARGGDDAATRRLLDDMQVSAAVNGDRLLFLGRSLAPGAVRDLTVDFEIELPSRVAEFEVATGAGDVRGRNLPGRAELQTRGGNITVDRLKGPLLAETRGGNIEIGSASGTARLITAGGSVRLESAGGEVVVQTSGGDVFIGRASAQVRAESGGGNVTVEAAGGDVSAQTRGGSIGIGDVRGEVIAVTAGGSIRVASARGGVRCESGAGPIFLKVIDGPIRAVTSAGNIQAEILPAGRTLFDSEIQTWSGDVLLALPESPRVSIRAIVDNSQGRRIRSDFPLRIYREAEDAGRPVEIAEGAIGGGGPLIKIRTLDGNIVIQKAKIAQPQ